MRLFLRITIPLLVILAAAGVITLLSERDAVPELSRKVGKRAGQIPNDWFHIQKAYPYDEVPLGAYRRAREQAQAMMEAHLAAQQGKTAAATWSSVGPSNIGGRITAIGAHAS